MRNRYTLILATSDLWPEFVARKKPAPSRPAEPHPRIGALRTTRAHRGARVARFPESAAEHPDKPRSSKQQYHTTDAGRAVLATRKA